MAKVTYVVGVRIDYDPQDSADVLKLVDVKQKLEAADAGQVEVVALPRPRKRNGD